MYGPGDSGLFLHLTVSSLLGEIGLASVDRIVKRLQLCARDRKDLMYITTQNDGWAPQKKALGDTGSAFKVDEDILR